MVAVRKTRIDELVNKGNRTAKLVQDALSDLDRFISSTQLGITFASLALGWIGEPAIASLLEPLFSFLPKNIAFISVHTLSIIIAFIIITFLQIVIGELVPKTIAFQRAEKISLLIIVPLTLFTRVFYPFIWVLNSSGALVIKVLGFTAPSGHQPVHSEEEIRMLLAQSVEGGAIPKKEAEMVYSVFSLGDTPVKQIIVPRTDMIAFNVSATLKEIVKKVQSHPHSRFPIYENNIDNVIGFVHIKDIYKEILKSKIELHLSETKLVRKIISVPESKRIDEVLPDMRRRRVHIAVVSDEYGGTTGMVTLEDILESLVGEIQDEFEQPVSEIQKQRDGSFIIEGLTSIETVQSQFDLPLKGQGYTTIGGLVFGLLGRQPEKGDRVQIGNIIFQVEKTEGKRINSVRLIILKRKEKAQLNRGRD